MAYDEEADRITKPISRNIGVFIITYYFPKLNQIKTIKEQYKRGDVFFKGPNGKVSVEMEARDFRTLNWSNLWDGSYRTISIINRKNPEVEVAPYDFYIAYNWNKWQQFAFINASALDNEEANSKRTDRGEEYAIHLTIDKVFYGEIIKNDTAIRPHIVKTRRHDESLMLTSLSEPDLTIR